MGTANFKGRAAQLTQSGTALIVLLAVVVVAAFAYFGHSGRGLAAASTLCVVITAIEFFKDLRRQLWFWIEIVVIGMVHAALVIVIPWPNGNFSAPLLFPIILLDLAVVYFCIRLGEGIGKIGWR